jgi:hypothetical protein
MGFKSAKPGKTILDHAKPKTYQRKPCQTEGLKFAKPGKTILDQDKLNEKYTEANLVRPCI